MGLLTYYVFYCALVVYGFGNGKTLMFYSLHSSHLNIPEALWLGTRSYSMWTALGPACLKDESVVALSHTMGLRGDGLGVPLTKGRYLSANEFLLST